MYQKILFLFILSLFLLSAGTQVHSQTEVLWSKKFHDLGGVKFSKDGQTVLIASKDTVYLFDAFTGEPTMYEKVHLPVINREILHIDISNDGTNFGALYSDTIRIWNYHSGEIINTLYIPVAGTFKFINNSRHFITKKWFDEENKWGFIIYDYDNGEEIKSGLAPNLTGITAFSNDDRYLAYATPGSSSFGIVLWDIETMKPITTLGYTSGIARDIAFSPDGKYLGVTDSDGYIKVWDLETKEKIVDMLHTDAPGKNLFAEQLCFTNDSQYLITCGGYFQDKTTKIWKIPEFELINYYKHPIASFYTIDISPNDSLLAMFFQFHVHIIGTDFTPTSIADNSIESEATIIPNPIKDLLTIELQNPILNTTIVKIYDSKGVLIEQISNNKLTIGSTSLTYNCSHLSPGAYFVVIEQGGAINQFSFVKL
jgi:WD40 repeat protein